MFFGSAVDPSKVALRALGAIPDLGLRPGDFLLLNTNDMYRYSLLRHVPQDPQALQEAMRQEQLEILDPAFGPLLKAYLQQQLQPRRIPRYGRLELLNGGRA